jgi:protein-tyrosine-phosphatase
MLPAGIQVLRKGAMHGAELAGALERTVQFVCLGNLNRSAFAAALLDTMQAWLAARLDGFVPAWRVCSSGLIAHPGQRVPPQMVEAAAARGVSLGQHVPARFDAAHANHDLLVAMGDDVAQAVETVARGEYLNLHVADPMGGPAEGYVQAAAHIARRLRQSLLGQWAPLGVEDARLESEFEKLFSGT